MTENYPLQHNNHQQIKAVFFDIDDTLFRKHNGFLPETARLAIQKLQDNGILVGIATGRTRCAFPEKINQMIEQQHIDTFVTMNGQYAVHQNNVIEKHPLQPHKVRKLVSFFDAHKIAYAFVASDKVCVSEITPRLKEALDPITTTYQVDKTFFEHNEVFQVLAFYADDQDELVAQAHILDDLKSVRWHENSVDIFDAEGSKARGIAAIARHLGFTLENVMAFGDGLNDIEMLKSVGIGVAMGNAHEELKKVADQVTSELEQDGIYQGLRNAGLIE